MGTMPAGALTVKHGKLGGMNILIALQGVTVPIDPTSDPSGYYAQLMQFAHTCWPIALMLGMYGALEVLVKLPHDNALLRWLDNGRVTIAVAGATAFLAATLNSVLNGAQLLPALMGGLGALLYFAHPQAVPVATKKLMSVTAPASSSQSGRLRISLMLMLAALSLIVFGMISMSCTSGVATDTIKIAEEALVDCTVKELADVKQIAIGLAPIVLGGSVQWSTVENTAVATGAKIGGCLLSDLGDEVARLGSLATDSGPHLHPHVAPESEAALRRFRDALKIKTRYRSESGEH